MSKFCTACGAPLPEPTREATALARMIRYQVDEDKAIAIAQQALLSARTEPEREIV